MIKTIPKKKCKKAKWLSEEALGIAEKRREVKGKEEKERYTQRKDILWNAEFQRIARGIKKAFLSDQCKETEENNRMGQTRDLFKKIWDTKGTFHTKMDTIVFAYLAAYDSSAHNFILETWPSCDTAFLIPPLISLPYIGFICRLTSALSLKAGSILGLHFFCLGYLIHLFVLT